MIAAVQIENLFLFLANRVLFQFQSVTSTGVTGPPYREVNSKIATATRLKVEDKDT